MAANISGILLPTLQSMIDFKLIEQLLSVHSPSGEEFRMREFLTDHIGKVSGQWKAKPALVAEPGFGDAFLLVFGEPRTVVFAHMDTIGFMTRYGNQLIPIGGPEAEQGYELVGRDSLGEIECRLQVDKHHNLFHDFPRSIDRGTSLVFKPNLRKTTDYIQSPYLDNRLGLYSALKVCETLEDGIVAFSSYEEQGGGSVPVLLAYVMQQHPVRQALISDITWVTEGVKHGEGVVISVRDRNIPRRLFIDSIIQLAEESRIPYQLEVEASGSSDGREVQLSPHGLDWCFIGAPEDHVHSPDEKVHLRDLQSMVDLYQFLMRKL